MFFGVIKFGGDGGELTIDKVVDFSMIESPESITLTLMLTESPFSASILKVELNSVDIPSIVWVKASFMFLPSTLYSIIPDFNESWSSVLTEIVKSSSFFGGNIGSIFISEQEDSELALQ